MASFKLHANFDFEAESEGEALQKLSEHFLALLEPNQGYNELEFRGIASLFRTDPMPEPMRGALTAEAESGLNTVWSKTNVEGAG